MELIFHEKQEGSLCAQHCLNALLQGSYYTAVDLAQIGAQLDQEEQHCMAEAGHDNPAYQTFLQQPSSNYDDSGYFSIQVIQKALRDWNLELALFSSSSDVAQNARKDPLSQKAYVCNFKEHWFTVRKIGRQWFNLNSLLLYPELLSDTYLSVFLAQLQQEGYSIFIVLGMLPACDADMVLSDTYITQSERPPLLSEASQNTRRNNRKSGQGVFTVNDLQRALTQQSSSNTELMSDEDQLKMALALSLSEGEQFQTNPSCK